MVSIVNTTLAQTALKTLSAASKNLSATKDRVSTSYRINSAEDDAAYWSVATTLRSDVSAMQDALGLGASASDTDVLTAYRTHTDGK